jgi:hypothetical protein
MVADAYKLSMAKFVYKQQHNLLPSIFENHYTKIHETHNHGTRQKELLKVDNKPNKNHHSENMSTITGAKIWNELPEDIRKAKTLSIFKNLCKNHYINKYIL